MATGEVLRPTSCAICHTRDNAVELYPASFDPEDLNAATFSARRLPDRVHYRLVRCRSCGLVRSDPVADTDTLRRLYAASRFDYAEEVPNLRLTYSKYLEQLGSRGRRSALLEIGCGNGFMLAEAQRLGYGRVTGVEPSEAAVASASPSVRPAILCDMMRPGLFKAEEFDAVCLFQVLDHIVDPGALLTECRRVLKPGGSLLCVNHDVQALSSRILGERSPIVDIEHTYLYSRATQRRLLESYGFRVREVGSASNRCSVTYLARLLPLPPIVKGPALAAITRGGLGRLSVWLRLGNLYLVAGRPSRLTLDEARQPSTPGPPANRS